MLSAAACVNCQRMNGLAVDGSPYTRCRPRQMLADTPYHGALSGREEIIKKEGVKTVEGRIALKPRQYTFIRVRCTEHDRMGTGLMARYDIPRMGLIALAKTCCYHKDRLPPALLEQGPTTECSLMQGDKWDGENYITYVFLPVDDVRFVNHSSRPNCIVQEENYNLVLRACRPIKKAEELTINYGKNCEMYVSEESSMRNPTAGCRYKEALRGPNAAVQVLVCCVVRGLRGLW